MKIVNELADHGSTNDQRATSSNDQTFPRSLVEGRKRPVLIFPVEISRRKDKRRERKCADANTITSASEKECSNWPGAVRFDKNALRSETTSGTNISSLSSSVQSVQKVDDTKVDGSRSEEKELSGPVARLQDARWGKSSRENERRKRERRKGERRADKGERVEGESRRENKSRVWNKNVRTAVGSRRVTDPTASDKGRAGRNDEDGDRRKKRKIGRSKIRNWERALLQGRRVPSERYRERPGGGGGGENLQKWSSSDDAAPVAPGVKMDRLLPTSACLYAFTRDQVFLEFWTSGREAAASSTSSSDSNPTWFPGTRFILSFILSHSPATSFYLSLSLPLSFFLRLPLSFLLLSLLLDHPRYGRV